MVDICARHLLTPFGLRSLASGEPGYQGRYRGDLKQRDSAYHQGTVWAWLTGPFISAYLRVHNDPQAACALLQPLLGHLEEAGLGTLGEVFNADPSHAPEGCFAQAWSAAEVRQALAEIQAASQSRTG